MSDQQAVIEFLANSTNYDAADEPVECIESHGSLVFLRGDRAYKLKRAVAFAGLDFRTMEDRRRACLAELRLNRRTAPQLYLEVRSINRSGNGVLSFNGLGPALDWVVVMRRFPQEALFSRMAEARQLSPGLMASLGAQIASFHASAQTTPTYGGAAGIRLAIGDNQRELSRYPQWLPAPAVQALQQASYRALERYAEQLEQRRAYGRVRRCHGDLRLANICLFEGRPTLFDGIEFSDQISCIDVLYDIAFVLMDLRHHGLESLAAHLLLSYLAHSSEPEDCEVLPLFLSLRAATRSYALACSATRQKDPVIARQKGIQAQSLLRQATGYLASDSTLMLSHLHTHCKIA